MAEQVFSKFTWTTQRMSKNCPSVSDFARWMVEECSIWNPYLGKRDYEYSLSIGNYHSPWPEPTRDFNDYEVEIIDDAGFTVEIAGTDYIVGTVTIRNKYLHHRAATFLVAHPQECNSYIHFSMVDNNRW